MLPRSLGYTALALAGFLITTPATGVAQRAPAQAPVLTAFSISGGTDTVSDSEPSIALVHTIVGTRPTEYRVSHRADFAGSRWEAYSGTLALRDWYDRSGPACNAIPSSHRVTLYLQVRATLGEEVRVVDGQRQLVPARVESNVLRATVCAHPVNKSPIELQD